MTIYLPLPLISQSPLRRPSCLPAPLPPPLRRTPRPPAFRSSERPPSAHNHIIMSFPTASSARICKITFSTGAVLRGISRNFLWLFPTFFYLPFPFLLSVSLSEPSRLSLFLARVLWPSRADGVPAGVLCCGRSVCGVPCFQVTYRDRYAILKRALMNFWHLISCFPVNISQLTGAGPFARPSEDTNKNPVISSMFFSDISSNRGSKVNSWTLDFIFFTACWVNEINTFI